MNRIRLLSEQVANQIAAGEVVERPASVVKELVENALDAFATRITVEVHAGGRSLIRITDDGIGMSKDDALLCLERHATSKIQKAEDLSAIATMGFRGEAVPSIASVSRFSLTTREREPASAEATQVFVVGGKIQEVKSAGSPPGTTVEIRQLFFNVPARKKFLRTEETEFAHIQHYLTLAALAYPHVGFTLIKDSKTVFQLPPSKLDPDAGLPFAAVASRLQSLLGSETALLRVDFFSELAEIPTSILAQDESAYHDLSTRQFRLWGFIGQPGVSRASRDQHYVFVNRRPVENRGIHHALLEGYHTSLMKGRYPVCCLFLDIDPARVDVNIHPTKREVRFHNEAEIRRLTAEAVRQTLLRFHRSVPVSSSAATATPRAVQPLSDPTPLSRETSMVLSESAPAPSAMLQTPELLAVPATVPVPLRGSGAGRASVPGALPQASIPGPTSSEPGIPAAAEVFKSPAASHVGTQASVPSSEVFADPSQPSSGLGTSHALLGTEPLLQGPLRILGVVGRLFVLMESSRGLVVMDQHAAHERILFEQMLTRLEQGHSASQRLLLPETVELPPRDADFVRHLLPTLCRLGVGLSEFGERTFLLDGLPPFVRSTDARHFVLGLVDELKRAGEGVNRMRLGEEVIAKTVCRHSVKANDELKGPELEGLLQDLRRCAMPYTCPHGRPTLIEMSYRELEKRFGRVQ